MCSQVPPQVPPLPPPAAPGETWIVPADRLSDQTFNKLSVSVPAAEPQLTTVQTESEREDKTDNRPLPPRCVCACLCVLCKNDVPLRCWVFVCGTNSMIDWIKHGIEKVVPQPEIPIRSKTEEKNEAPLKGTVTIKSPWQHTTTVLSTYITNVVWWPSSSSNIRTSCSHRTSGWHRQVRRSFITKGQNVLLCLLLNCGCLSFTVETEPTNWRFQKVLLVTFSDTFHCGFMVPIRTLVVLLLYWWFSTGSIRNTLHSSGQYVNIQLKQWNTRMFWNSRALRSQEVLDSLFMVWQQKKEIKIVETMQIITN